MSASESDNSCTSSLNLLSPRRWLWAASRVEKMSGGLTRASRTMSMSSVWSQRLLILPGYTGCLHWLKDDGNTQITTLGIERGFVRLTDIKDIQVDADEDCETDNACVLVLDAEHFLHPLRFRAAREKITAWKSLLEAAKDYALTHQNSLWFSGSHSSQFQKGLWESGSHERATEDPLENCPIDVDDVLKFDDDRIQSMGFVKQMLDVSSSSTPTCFSNPMQTGPKFRLFLVVGNQVRWFDPRDGLVFGDRRGSCNLSAIRSAKPLQGNDQTVEIKTDKGKIVMKTPGAEHCSQWVSLLHKCEKSPDDIVTAVSRMMMNGPLSSLSDGSDTPPLPLRGLQNVRDALSVVVLWNISIFLALTLRGTYFFWLLILSIDVALFTWFVTGQRSPGTGHPTSSKDNEDIDENSQNCKFLQTGSESGCVEDAGDAQFQVRGPHYLANGEKVDSEPAFYELVRVQVMSPTGCKNRHVCADGAVLEQEVVDLPGPLPQFFVLNFQLPEDQPSWRGRRSGSSRSVVFYFRVRPETQNSAQDEHSGNAALRLLKAYCSGAATDRSLQDKLKVICSIGNIADVRGLPTSLHRYNSKPKMVRSAGTLFQEPGHLELDVDISDCSYMVRDAFYQLKSKISSMELGIAVVIQGDSEDQLPERVWASAQLHHIDLDVQASDTAPRTAGPTLSRDLSESPRSPVMLRRRGALRTSSRTSETSETQRSSNSFSRTGSLSD